MPTAPTGSSAWSDRKPKKKKKLKKPVVPRQADTGDRARSNPAPSPPPEKVRKFAHPNRKEPQKVIARAVAHEQVQATKRAATRKAVKRIKVTPVPSPDARDSTRSAAQRSRDKAESDKNIRSVRRDIRDLPKIPGATYVKQPNGKLHAEIHDREKFAAAQDKRLRPGSAAQAPVLKVLEQTTRPLHAVAAAAKHDVKEYRKHGVKGIVGHGSLKAASKGIQNKDKSTFSDVLAEAGVKNKAVKGAVGFGLDVALDPTTYLTLGGSSAAKQAGTSAARKAEAKAFRSTGAKIARDEAAKQATRRGATVKEARVAGKVAQRKHARRAGKSAGDFAAAGKQSNNGLRISFAGRDVPVVTRATAAGKRAPRAVARKTRVENTRVGRSVDRAQQRVRDTSRNFASDFNPAIAPAGVDRTAYQAARRSARTARAGAQRGTFRAGQRAVAFRKAFGEKNYERVLDAIETGTIKNLPKELRAPARELQRDFAWMLKNERRAGIKVGSKGDTYVKHLRVRPQEKPGGVPRVGSKKVDPSFAKGRLEGTIAEKNTREPGAYSTDVAEIYLNRGAESAVSISKAKLNQAMERAGRKPDRSVPIKDQLADGESLYRIEGSDLEKVKPKGTLPAKGGRYVILNEKLLSRTRGTVDAAAERSTAGVFFDRAQGVWKLAATQINPGYHVRNFAGEAQNAYLAENPIVLGRNAVQAARALRQLGREEDALRVLGAKAKDNGYGDFIRQAEDVGAVRAGQLGREVGDMLRGTSAKNQRLKVRRGLLRKPARALKNAEDVFRLATYKGGIDRGLSPERAMERASRNHFDYGDLTPLERKVLRRAAPFWTFSARNIPLQARTLLSRPGKFANYQKIREELQNAFGVPDDWDHNDLSESEQRSAPFPVKIGGKTYNIGLGPSGLPLTDLNEFPSTGDPAKQADEWMERAMSMLTPAAKTPVELWANFSFFFRDSIEKEDGPLAPAPSWVSKIPRKYREQVGITPNYRDPRTGKSGWGAPAKVVYALNVLPGPANFGNRLATESTRPGQSKTAKTVQYLGPRIRQNDPVTVKINSLYDQKAKLEKKRGTLGQENHPGSTVKITAATATPEYRKVLTDIKRLEYKIALLKIQRGDKGIKLPGAGRRSGGVKLPGSSSRVKTPGSSSRIKIP